LDLDPVAGEDPDAEAPHLPRQIAHRLLPVVEREAVLAVREGLDGLTVELDLLFLVRHGPTVALCRYTERTDDAVSHREIWLLVPLRRFRVRRISNHNREEYLSHQTFAALGVSAPVVDALAARDIITPFRIQTMVLE